MTSSSDEDQNEMVCVVTGGSRGIGEAICIRLAQDGYKVAVNYNANTTQAEEVVKRIREGGGTAMAIQANVSLEADVVRMLETVDKELGPVTACVNNAAILGPLTGLLDSETSEDMQTIMATNLFGSFYVMREAAKRMSTKRGGKGGAIVNISAGAAFTGEPLAYAMSKGALNTLTEGCVKELTPQGIRVNTISPGPTNTDMMKDFSEEEIAGMEASIPMGRAGQAKEVASAVSFLLSSDSSYISGTNLRVAGGKPLAG